MDMSTRSSSLIYVVFCLALIANPIISSADNYHLTILHNSDHHGHFMKFSPYGNPDVGGIAARSTLVNIVRAEVEDAGGHVLLLSGGDVNIGVPESDLLDAEPDFKLMNMLGYDAIVLGNHEFDNLRDVLMQQQEWAGCPFLAANVVKKGTGEFFVEPYIIKEFGGLKVAIFGLTMEETKILALPEPIEDLEIRSVIETAQELVPKLREQADVVIALTHIGFYETSGAGYRTPGDLKLAKEVPGIDVIVGGQSGTVLEEPEIVGDTIIAHAGEYGLYVGRLDLTIGNDTAQITEYRYKLLPVNLKRQITYHDTSYYMYVDNGYVEDPTVLEFIQPYLERTDELLAQPVGETLGELVGEKQIIRSQETNLANMVTDAMRAKIGAEIFFCNSGGIRASIKPGLITYRDLLTILPFGNTLVLLDMTGTQIMDVLNYAATIKPGNGGFLHASGLTWTNNKGIPENVMVGNSPIELDRMYKVGTHNFLAAGGDGYTMLKDVPQYDTGFVDASTLREYIMKQGTVAPKVEGRLTIIE